MGWKSVLLAEDNLSTLTSTTTARSNLGLGDSAILNVGTAAGTVAAGDHTHSTSSWNGGDLGPTINHTRGDEVIRKMKDSDGTYSIYETVNDGQGNYNLMLGIDGDGVSTSSDDGFAKLLMSGHGADGSISLNAQSVGSTVAFSAGLVVDGGTNTIRVGANSSDDVGLRTGEGNKIADMSGNLFSGGTAVSVSGHTHSYDNYGSWNLKTNSTQRTTVTSGGDLDLIAGSNVSLSYAAGGKVTINSSTYSAGTHLSLSGTTFNVDFATVDKVVKIGHNSTNNEGEIILDTSIAGSPQIAFTEHGDASWAIGVDDGDNSFKIHGNASSTIPTINNLATPNFEIKTNGVGYLAGSRIFADNYHPNADTLTTARTIALSGAVTGSASFNGSAGITIATTATADPTLTLSGDASGSATFTNLGDAALSVTVANDSHTHDGRYYTETETNGFLNLKANLESPALTGNPTAPTQAANNNSTRIATTAYVQTKIGDLIGGAPAALDTLNELAAALSDDADFSTTVTNSIATKLPLAGGTMTGELQVNARLDVGDGTGNDHEIRIYKKDNNVSDHIQFYNGTTRIGEIGCEDTTWLRINQETSKNIYTPRYIRADGGFYVDGTSKGINGSGNYIGGTITGASDANVSNWDTAYTHSQATHAPSDAQANRSISDSVTSTSSSTSASSQAVKTAYDTGNHNHPYAASYHTHGYLPLGGGTLTGDLTVQSTGDVGITINADTDNVNEDDIPYLSFKMDGSGERLRLGVANDNHPYISTDSDLNLDLYIKGGTDNGNIAKFHGSSKSTTLYGSLTGTSATFSGDVTWSGGGSANANTAYTHSQSAHSYLPLSGGTMTGTLDLNVADSLSFEGGKHWITYNDGEGNFNIRVGHKSDDLTNEVCTETGYVFHDEWSQSSGWREFNVSGSSIPTVGDDVGSWRKQIYYDYNEVGLAYQGSNKFKTTSGGVNITGNIAVSGTVDGRDVATDGSKLDGIASSANNYSLPAGSSSTRGGFKIGYAESGKNYPVEVSSEKMYVNVPWTDNNTTYSAGSLLDLSGTTFNVDLSELTELQGWQNGHQFTLVDSHGEQGYLLPADIDLADFDNTAGWASGDFEIGTQNTASATTTLSYDSGDTLVLQNDGTGDFLTGRKQGQEKFNITNTGAATFASVTTSGGNVVDDEHFTQITHHAYYSSSTSGVYIPAAGTLSEQTSVQYYNKFLAPYAGKVKKVIINCSSAPGLTDMTVYQGSTTIGAQTLYVPSAGHATSFDFAGGTSTFSKHDDIRIKIDPTSPAYQVFVTVVWEYNLTT